MTQFTGPVYELVLKGELLGQEVANVFHYGLSAGSGNADLVCSDFAGDMLPSIVAIASQDLTYTEVNARGVQIATDFDDNLISEAGLALFPTEPRFVAWSYRANRPDGLSRHGFKRFAGVADGWWEDGEIDPTYNSLLQAVATAWAGGLASAGATWVPLVQRRPNPPSPGSAPTYWTFNTATFRGITTQNTRK